MSSTLTADFLPTGIVLIEGKKFEAVSVFTINFIMLHFIHVSGEKD